MKRMVFFCKKYGVKFKKGSTPHSNQNYQGLYNSLNVITKKKSMVTYNVAILNVDKKTKQCWIGDSYSFMSHNDDMTNEFIEYVLDLSLNKYIIRKQNEASFIL